MAKRFVIVASSSFCLRIKTLKNQESLFGDGWPFNEGRESQGRGGLKNCMKKRLKQTNQHNYSNGNLEMQPMQQSVFSLIQSLEKSGISVLFNKTWD